MPHSVVSCEKQLAQGPPSGELFEWQLRHSCLEEGVVFTKIFTPGACVEASHCSCSRISVCNENPCC